MFLLHILILRLVHVLVHGFILSFRNGSLLGLLLLLDLLL